MADISSRVRPAQSDQPFDFVTALPIGSKPEDYYEIGNVDIGTDGSKDVWLAHLQESKAMVRLTYGSR